MPMNRFYNGEKKSNRLMISYRYKIAVNAILKKKKDLN